MGDKENLKQNLIQNFPAELRASSRWVLFRLENAPPKDGKPGRERCKVPYDAKAPSRRAESTGPDSWASLDAALNALPKFKADAKYQHETNAVGIGLVFGAPFFGVDLDHCLEDGKPNEFAQDFLKRFPATYAEVSISGDGLHLWYRCTDHAKLPAGCRSTKAEAYSRGRYFTVTGQKFGESGEVTELSLAEAKKIFEFVKEAKKEAAPAASAGRGSAKLQDLMIRTDFPDLSQAVQSLLTHLAIETICDTDQIESRFKESALYQDTHWKGKWERLRDSELKKAIEHGRENLQRQLTKKAKPEEIDPDSWPKLFASYDELSAVEDKDDWIIKQWAREGDISIIGALPKHGKTWLQLAIAKALLTGEPLFGHWAVKRATRVVYLIPEAGMRQVKRRLVKMRMMEFVREGRLFIMPRTISMVRELSDSRLLKAAEGADVFLDTAIRFIEGDENKAVDVKVFSEKCLNLATVARTVWGAHHARKDFEEASQMTLGAMLRGSNDLAAMLSNAFGMAQLDREKNLVRVESLAQRDDDEFLAPFHLEGRPHIDNEGNFRLVAKPGEAGSYSEHKKKNKGGRPADPNHQQKLDFIRANSEKSDPEITEALNKEFNSEHNRSTITRWRKETAF